MHCRVGIHGKMSSYIFHRVINPGRAFLPAIERGVVDKNINTAPLHVSKQDVGYLVPVLKLLRIVQGQAPGKDAIECIEIRKRKKVSSFESCAAFPVLPSGA